MVMKVCLYRFTQNLTTKRRENAEKLAEKAIAEARKKKEAAAAAEATEDGVSSSVTPASSPTEIKGIWHCGRILWVTFLAIVSNCQAERNLLQHRLLVQYLV